MRVANRPGRSSERSAPASAAAWTALAALVLGVPLLLAVLIGWPLSDLTVPRSAPHDPWTVHTAAKVAELLVWFLWAQFTACVAVEVRSARTGVEAPSRVPGAAPSRAMAKALVTIAFAAAASAAVLQHTATPRPLAAVSVSAHYEPAPAQAAHLTSAQAPRGRLTAPQSAPRTAAPTRAAAARAAAARPAAEAQQAYAASDAGFIVSDRSGTPGPQTADPASVGAMPTALDSAGSVKYYVVTPPNGRGYDSLWEIAQRYLGDGRRYNEIFALNDGRRQPNGGELSKANLILPGWILALPGDAQGPGLTDSPPGTAGASTGPLAPVGTIPPTSVTSEPPSSGGSGTPAASAPKPAEAGTAHRETEPAAAGHGSAAGPTSAPPRPAVVRPSTAPADAAHPADEGSLISSIGHALPYVALIGSPVLAAALLSALGAATRRQRRDRPPTVFAAPPDPPVAEVERTIRAAAAGEAVDFLDRALRSLRAETQARGRAVPPIRLARVDPRGVALVLDAPDLAAPAPWTALAGGAVWRWEDVEAPAAPEHGPVPSPLLWCVGALGEEQIFVNLESGDRRCAMVNGPARARRAVLAAAAAALAAAPWADQVRIEAVGLPAELGLIAPQRLRIHPDVDSAMTVLERESAATGPHLVRLLIAEPVDAVDLARIDALTARDNGASALLGTTWQEEGTTTVVADAVGRVQVSGVQGEITASRLPDPLAAALGALFTAAAAPRYVPIARPADTEPLGGADLLDRPAGVRAALLGPVEILGVPAADAARGPLFTEALVLLLFHRAGLTPSVIARALWPRGITPAARDRMLRDLRDWLGEGPDGPRLVIEPNGPVRLSADVRSDWDEFLGAYRDADRLPPQQAAQADAGLRRALTLVRGELLGDRPPGRYSWLGFGTQDTEVPAVVADAASRIAARALEAGEPGDALWAAEQGLLGAPDDERLNQLKIRALGALGDREVLLAAVADLKVRTWFRYGEPDLPAATNEVIDELTGQYAR
jgi:hypothetical protein